MRLEDQSCKCECSKIVAEMYSSNRLNSAARLDSLLSPELRFSTSIRQHEESKKHSTRRCSIVDDQPKISRPRALSRTDSQHERTSKSTTNERKSSRLSVRAASFSEHSKSFSFLDVNNVKLSKDAKQLKHKKRTSGLSRNKVVKYSKGLYPGIVIGHVNCVDSPVFVPKNMGWLWNITDEVTGRKPHPEWIPGAVPKYLQRMINHITLELDGQRIENPLAPIPSKKKLVKHKTDQSHEQKGSHKECDTQPTLHLHTKKGVYCIKVLPDEDDDYRKKPMVFTIGQEDNEMVSSSDSSLEIELIRPDMNLKCDTIQENLQESVEEQGITETIESSKSIVTKKKKNASKKNNVKL